MSEDTNKNTTQDQVQEPQKEENLVEKTPVKEVEEDLIEETEVQDQEEEQSDVEEEVLEEGKTPEFRSGDTVRVHYKIIEGNKTRIQPYEGIVIARKGKGMSKTFTVRKIGADNVGVERIFPLFSPNIEKIEVKKRGKVRRAKLYYLREKQGKEAMRIRELGK